MSFDNVCGKIFPTEKNNGENVTIPIFFEFFSYFFLFGAHVTHIICIQLVRAK